MNVKTFIDRPLFSIVISVFIVALGVIALTSLPVEKYPDIAPPTIKGRIECGIINKDAVVA